MKPEAIFFGLAVAAPIVCHFFAQTTASRAALSASGSVVLMAMCLVIGEALAPLPDYDIVFGVYFIAWNVVAVIYAIGVSLSLSAIAGVIKRVRRDEGAAEHEE